MRPSRRRPLSGRTLTYLTVLVIQRIYEGVAHALYRSRLAHRARGCHRQFGVVDLVATPKGLTSTPILASAVPVGRDAVDSSSAKKRNGEKAPPPSRNPKAA